MFSNNHHLTLHATTCNCPYIYLAENHHKCKECLLHLKPRIALILCNCVCDQKVAIFCQTSQIFAGRSLATVKKICEVERKMALFVPDSAPLTSYNPFIPPTFTIDHENKRFLCRRGNPPQILEGKLLRYPPAGKPIGTLL